MLVVSDLHVDPRVRNSAQALARAGYSVTVIWPELPSKIGLPIDWGTGISFQPLKSAASAFAYRFPGVLGRDMLSAAMAHRPFAFHGHDLTTSLVALTAANARGAHAVCDFHEWFSEHVTWSDRKRKYIPLSFVRRRVNKRLERLALERASAVVTVCESIASAMDQEYGDGRPQVHVVRNIGLPAVAGASNYPSLREQMGLHRDEFLVLYQGGVGPSRALEPVIQALAHVPHVVLAIRGPSIEAYSDHYRRVAKDAGVEARRLALLPPVPSADTVAACAGADAGLYTVADTCKSFTCALPNKVFEYMHAGLPVLVADYPEVRRFVVDTGAGVAFDPTDPKSIAYAIQRLGDGEVRAQMIERGRCVLDSIKANEEWQRLVSIYDQLANASGEKRPSYPVGRELKSQRAE